MTIPLIDKIKPKNNGSFPVYDDVDGYGGFQVRLNTADRDSIPSLNRKAGMLVKTLSDGYYWELSSNLQDWHQAPFSAGSAIAVDLNITGQTKGSTLYFDGNGWEQLPPSIDGYVLTTHSSGQNPTWSPATTISTLSPIDVDKSAAVIGTSSKAAREDHKHNISTASAVSIGTVNAEGTSTALARADHTHNVTGFNIPGQTQGDILYFNGTSWVKLTAGQDGYFLQTHSSGPIWASATSIINTNAYVPTWYVNQSTGLDTNDGLTSGTALKTIEELCNRLCPNGAVAFLKQTTTINIASGSYGSANFRIGSGTLIINAALSSTANITTNAVTNTNASIITRGEIETASGTFIDLGRIRITSGTATGAIAFCTGFNGGTNKAFVSSFISSTGTQVNITNGNTVVNDSLIVSFNKSSFLTQNKSANIIINNIILNDCYSNIGVTFNNCNLVNSILIGGSTLTFCSIQNSSINNGYYNGYGNQFLGTCSSTNAQIEFTASNVFDDCNTFVGSDVNFKFVDLELIRRTQTVGLIFPVNSNVISTGYLWSGTGSYATTGVQLDPGAYFSFAILPVVGGLNNITLAGVGFTWAQLPKRVGSTAAEYNVIYTSTANDINYWTGNYWERLPAGQDGYVLTTHGTSNIPSWNLPWPGDYRAVATISDRNTINPILRKSGLIVYVAALQVFYQLADDLVTWNFYNSSPALSNQATWYVNGSAGSDGYDGKTAGTALATLSELSARISPYGATRTLAQNTTVFIAAGTYTGDNHIRISLAGHTMTIQGAVTSGSSITLNSVTNTVAGTTVGGGTRGRIGTASGTFVAGQMLRCTAGSNVGAVAFVHELDGDAQHAYVTMWHTADPLTPQRGTQVNLTSGDVVVPDTNAVTVDAIVAETIGNCSLLIRNLNGSMNFSCKTENDFSIIFDACTGGFSSNANASGGFMRCSGGWFTTGGYIQYLGGNYFSGNYLYDHTKIDFSGGDYVSGAGFQFYDCEVAISLDWAAGRSTGGLQFEKITSPCITIGTGSRFIQGFSLRLWGVSGSSAAGLSFQPSSQAIFNNLPTITAVNPMVLPDRILSSYSTFELLAYDVSCLSSTGIPASALDNAALVVANNTARDVIPSYARQEGMIVYSKNTKVYYSLDANLTTWNMIDVNTSLASQTTWYVNGATGDDGYDGKTSGTALRTSEELSRRLCPFGNRFIPNQDVTINFAAGIGSTSISYGELCLNCTTSHLIKIVCEYTSGPSITLSAVTNTSVAVARGQVTTVGSTSFTANARIRSTSGAAIGAITYSTGANANSKNHFVKEWINYATLPSPTTVASGTTCVVDTLLVSFSRLDIRIDSLDNTTNGYFELWDAKLTKPLNLQTQTRTGTLSLIGCEYTGLSGESGNIFGSVSCFNCSFLGETSFSEQYPLMYGCIIQPGATIYCYPGTQFALFMGNCFNGGHLVAIESANNIWIGANVEFCNGDGAAAIEVKTCSNITIVSGKCWGLSTPYAIGVKLGSLCKISTPNNTTISIPATIQAQLSGHNHNYSDIPVAYPNADCVWAIDPDSNALSFASTVRVVADNTARDAIPSYARQEGMLVYSKNIKVYYSLDANLTTWSFYDSSPTLASQTVWYVDPTGNDGYDGKTLSTALATLSELELRLWPNGRRQKMTNDVTLYINTANPTAWNFPQLIMNVSTDEPLTSGLAFYTFNVILGKVSSAPIVLSSNAVIPVASTNQRGQFATASGTFLDDELIEVTSGLGIGGVGYAAGLNGNAQHVFYTALTVPTIAGTTINSGHGQDIKPLSGDTVVTTQLVTTITRLEITCSGFARVFVQYAKITRLSINGSSINTVYAGSGGPVFISCCQQISSGGRWENNCGGAFLLQCRTVRNTITALYGTGWTVIGHAIQGVLQLNGQVISYGVNVDGGQLKIGNGDDNNHPGESVFSKWLAFSCYTNLFSGGTSGSIEFSRGSLITGSTIYNSCAILVAEGSEFLNTDFNGWMWGATTSLYDYGIVIMSNSRVVQGNISSGILGQIWQIPSTVNIVLDNLYFAFSDNTITIPNSLCGFINGNYNTTNNYNETDAGFYLTNQNANIGATSFSQIRKPGLYRVMGYVAVTTADAAATGTPVLNITWKDDSGVSQTLAVATGTALTTLGGNGGQVVIECGSSLTLVTWSITGVTSAGTSKFSVRMRVEKDCFGA